MVAVHFHCCGADSDQLEHNVKQSYFLFGFLKASHEPMVSKMAEPNLEAPNILFAACFWRGLAGHGHGAINQCIDLFRLSIAVYPRARYPGKVFESA